MKPLQKPVFIPEKIPYTSVEPSLDSVCLRHCDVFITLNFFELVKLILFEVFGVSDVIFEDAIQIVTK